jgi:hypothetical protein
MRTSTSGEVAEVPPSQEQIAAGPDTGDDTDSTERSLWECQSRIHVPTIRERLVRHSSSLVTPFHGILHDEHRNIVSVGYVRCERIVVSEKLKGLYENIPVTGTWKFP